MVDYLKGYRRVVLEEFYNTLIELPTIYLYPIRVLAFIFKLIRQVMELGYFGLDRIWFSHLNFTKNCIFQVLFGYNHSDTYD